MYLTFTFQSVRQTDRQTETIKSHANGIHVFLIEWTAAIYRGLSQLATVQSALRPTSSGLPTANTFIYLLNKILLVRMHI